MLPHAGGTRFIGVYLARQLIEAGHEVTLLTRGKKPVTSQIPDDTDQSYEAYKQAVKHIACDRTDAAALKEKLGGQGFEGELMGVKLFAIEGGVLVMVARQLLLCQAGVQQGARDQHVSAGRCKCGAAACQVPTLLDAPVPDTAGLGPGRPIRPDSATSGWRRGASSPSTALLCVRRSALPSDCQQIQLIGNAPVVPDMNGSEASNAQPGQEYHLPTQS